MIKHRLQLKPPRLPTPQLLTANLSQVRTSSAEHRAGTQRKAGLLIVTVTAEAVVIPEATREITVEIQDIYLNF